MNKTKTNKGITLVALVITIIVLIILAGVSINAVMNDGLIKNSKEAKNEYEIAEQNEIEVLGELYQETEEEMLKQYFEKNKENLSAEYKINEGLITGVFYQTVGEFLSDLGGLYEIWNRENTEKIADDDYAVTGDILKKDGQIIAIMVLYGDVDNIPGFNHGDIYLMDDFRRGEVEVEDYQKVAMDVNHDGKINDDDRDLISWLIINSFDKVNQNVEAPDPDTITVEPIVTE